MCEFSLTTFTYSVMSVIPRILLIVDCENGKFTIRALLDPGSQGTLVTESAAQLLRLKIHKSN